MADIGGIVRELLIKIGVLGGPEARAEVDATAASVEKVGAAGTAAAAATTASSTEQANALKNVADSLSRASANAASFAETSREVKGGEVVYQALAGSVSNLETSIRKAQAVGAIVPPATLKSLDDMKAGLAAATAAVAPHVAAVGGAGKAHAETGIQMEAGRAAIGGWARAIRDATESTNPFVAAIGKFLLPIAAAAGALAVFNKVAGELKERGVDISTIGDRWGLVMDTLAIALGGTSKAMAGMIADMEKTQAGFTGLSDTQKAFASGFDLMNAAIRPTDEQLRLFASVAESIPPELASMGGGLDNVGVKARVAMAAFTDTNTQLNQIRATAPALAQALTEEYLAIQKMTQGSDEQNKALAEWNIRVKAGAASSEDFVRTLKAMYPGVKNVEIEFEKLTQGTTRFADGLKIAQAAGLTQQQTMALLGPLINSVGKGYDEFGLALKIRNPELVATAQAASRMREAFDPLKVKLHEMAVAAEEELKSFTGLVDSISKAAAKTGDYRAALEAAHKEIDSRITSLEKLQTSTKGLSTQEDAELKSLLAMHKVMTDLTPAQEKYNKEQEAGLKAAHDLSKSYEDLTRAREKDKEAIEKHRQEEVKGIDEGLKKAVEAGNAQVKALDEQHKAMEISDSEYYKSVNEIFAKEAQAHRAAMDAEDKINAEAAKKEQEHQKTYEEAAGEIAQALVKINETLVTAKEKQAEYDAAAAISLEKVRGEWDKTTAKIRDHLEEYPKLNIAWGNFQSGVTSGVAIVDSSLGGLLDKLKTIREELGKLDGISSRVLSIGGGGASPEQPGPPTPAPEPSGSAPGSEFTT